MFKTKLSIRKKLVLMFLGTTIAVHLMLGEIAVYRTKTYFEDLGLEYIHHRYETINQSASQFMNPRTTEGFDLVWGLNDLVWSLKEGQVGLQNSEALPLPDPEKFMLKNKDETYSHQWRDGTDNYLAASYYLDESHTVVVGMNVNHYFQFFDAVKWLMLYLTLGVSILAAVYSIFIVNNGLRPLKKFEGYLSKIRPGNLTVRIPTDQMPAELKTLGVVQNSMLDRLENGFARLSDFSSDIAHELRTPLTNIMTQTQVVLSNDRSLTEYHDTLGSNLEELERINKTINDTLYLAKADNSLLYQDNQELDLHQEIAQVVEFHNIVAEDKGLTINLDGQGTLFCDKLMFQRAINNLLSNAIRHAYADSVIQVNINKSDEALTIAVLNKGDAIPEDSLPFIFDRFYRADKSREQDCTSCAGLGLAITKSIIEGSGGTITAESSNGNTQFLITVPNLANARNR